jgi:CRP/FNR family transcriptional regulator, cyclic AMP receptor protein
MLRVIEFCRSFPAQPFAPGAIILREGDRTGRLYVLSEGRVSIRKGNTEVARVDRPGSLFGEMSVLLDIPHSASVVAIDHVGMHIVPDAETFLINTPHAALVAARVVAQRLFDATSHLAELKIQTRDAEAHFGPVGRVFDTLAATPRPGQPGTGGWPAAGSGDARL